MNQQSASEKIREAAFFYAIKEAPIYDKIVTLTQKDYYFSHEALIELISFYLNDLNLNTPSILNIGCGTGFEAINILEKFPDAKLVCIDFSEEMIDVFKSNVGQLNKKYCIEYIVGDALKLYEIKDIKRAQHFDIIVSAYTLHHYTLSEKSLVYKKIYEMLKPGGNFINLDLANYNSKTLSNFSQEHILNWIKVQFENIEINLSNELTDKGYNLNELKNEWLNHITNINIPQIIEDSLSDTSTETNILKELNFSETGIPYRYFQSSILWAKK